MNLTAKAMLREAFGGAKNFLTPFVVETGKINKWTAFELASGSGLVEGTTLYGVTVVRVVSANGAVERDDEHSRTFHTAEEARDYIAHLKREMVLLSPSQASAPTRAEEAEKQLRFFLSEGSQVYGHLEHVSASGMTRYVRLYCVGLPEGGTITEIINLTGSVSDLLGEEWSEKHRAIVVHGCGFDAITDILQPLASRLFGRSDALKRDSL